MKDITEQADYKYLAREIELLVINIIIIMNKVLI